MPYFISYIPTEPELIDGFFELAPVSSTDVVYDLGCGDGRLLFAAIEHGAGQAVGIDIDRSLISRCTAEAKKRGLENKVTFINKDLMDVDLSQATVIFCYLIGSAEWLLKPKFVSELRSGARIVTEMFPIPNWKPNRTYADQRWSGSRYREFFLYIMPPVIDTASYLGPQEKAG